MRPSWWHCKSSFHLFLYFLFSCPLFLSVGFNYLNAQIRKKNASNKWIPSGCFRLQTVKGFVLWFQILICIRMGTDSVAPGNQAPHPRPTQAMGHRPFRGGNDTIILTIMFTGQGSEVTFNHFHCTAAVGWDVCLMGEVFVWPRSSAVDLCSPHLTSLSAPAGKH